MTAALMSHQEAMDLTHRVGKAHQGSITSEKGEKPVITADEGARMLQDRMLLIAVLRQLAPLAKDRQFLPQGTRQVLDELRI